MTRRAQANRTSRPPGGDVRRAPPTSRPWGTSQAGPGWPPSTEALAQRWNSARDDRIGTTPIEGVRVKLRSRAKHGSLIGHFDPSESSTAEPSDRPSSSSPRQAVGVAALGDGAVQSSPQFCSLAGWAARRLYDEERHPDSGRGPRQPCLTEKRGSPQSWRFGRRLSLSLLTGWSDSAEPQYRIGSCSTASTPRRVTGDSGNRLP